MTGGVLKDQSFIALDLETTGLSATRDRIVEVAAVRFQLETGPRETYNQLVNPGVLMSDEVIAIHGITDSDVASAPSFAEIAKPLEAFLEGSILLAHNASFDLAFLACEMRRQNAPYPTQATIDTCRLARLLLPEAPNYRLTTLIESFQLANHGPAHRALPDALACAELFKLCVSRLPLGPDTSLENFWENYPSVCHQLVSPAVSPKHPLAHALTEAIRQQVDIRIGYHNARNERIERIITPLFLAGRGNYTYLEAFCHLRQENRQFRLERVFSFDKILEPSAVETVIL
ncbi:hypothetical protein COW36_02685 [bacterium (Candidatus Blackallbacteria) CG17_big_fil_post_rev_8_21_14_2_50_48_46]|uniref:Exonuclease domain-containing protein n=1 Tax=bacterium (Candidatus Blackallbacteria) CG17_big_fil_post_rev_8_21_14_2_50_48_46 TaxID=2014261 RepID=A0A2M7GA67_9BACT|nr:MAG: hypothetical protein COW64_12790 [bacterium (Candidatus Blackallbacteria) CG18_big_fil_WC_8_21_14_2_50_49_26]PIW19035.1 MAG: hypothetical protein COW36_02685 [bacterium (Candidatus Blackallbacteria) CG17_big_fil_post_rev_8_21_14_2_50_48_46]PIW44598.1 MAG: hypothetical protein COW20_23435 [bacterium (Candidatus Blackallbacteria) CG13_big_fil_rev_8_21_14_2_50_49_14]